MNVIRQLNSEAVTADGLDDGIQRAIDWLADNQEKEGFWVGMLESNSCIEAEWILAMHLLGVKDDPKYDKVVQAILNEQREDGSWAVYYQAPAGDINATVEAYAALRAAGFKADDVRLAKARNWIFQHGGLRQVRVFTRYWLALIGEWPWEETPALAPEMIYLPSWCPLNIYDFACWARATLVPLTILSVRRPVKPLPPASRLDELFPGGRENTDYSFPDTEKGLAERFFLVVDWFLKKYSRLPVQFGREKAISLCLEWIVRHQDYDGGWGGIQPPLIYSLVALNVEGYALTHPVISKGLDAFNPPWAYEKNGGTYLQCSESPVWDTLFTLLALFESGCTFEGTPMMRPALDWILGKQITRWGDWQVKVRGVRPGGWAFERANTAYPDVDDTALALVVLSEARRHLEDTAAVDAALERAEEWILGLQCKNGGWAAFDRDNNSVIVTKIPFCDFGEVLDPPSVDVTAHVVEALATLGRDMHDPVVAKALRYIRSEQEPEGSWFGRWGVNHIYGTGAVLPALAAIGEDMRAPYVRRAADWLVAHQNADGGWGESCASYMDDSQRGRGPSTASQTGWALMALVAVASPDYDGAIRRGLDYLLSCQKAGTWDEPQYTGTGFPGYGVGERTNLKEIGATLGQGCELARGFMLNYNMYRHYFPLIAMARARRYLGLAVQPCRPELTAAAEFDFEPLRGRACG
ncbi:squalene--hopene cyclase [Syntrophotalea acetylenica]|uniref:Squalene-hopene cyclase n=1 Tax=Syntrophotalea acetylenica TaxID=29542 RepID=A0A1L3GG68_SYNAC|nr:squalene--hopene cyclase [Syntrophotalea acetylenica]APG24942.1 squalene-hopene cyclase [Syntrophotalea acetylenica]APG43007.1 squalene-hopene cyclase [Syntrophotalea acetylenica]